MADLRDLVYSEWTDGSHSANQMNEIADVLNLDYENMSIDDLDYLLDDELEDINLFTEDEVEQIALILGVKATEDYETPQELIVDDEEETGIIDAEDVGSEDPFNVKGLTDNPLFDYESKSKEVRDPPQHLQDLIPTTGTVQDSHLNPELEKLRILLNLNYEVSNNGGDNWQWGGNDEDLNIINNFGLSAVRELYETQVEFGETDDEELDDLVNGELFDKALAEVEAKLDEQISLAEQEYEQNRQKEQVDAFGFWGNESKATEDGYSTARRIMKQQIRVMREDGDTDGADDLEWKLENGYYDEFGATGTQNPDLAESKAIEDSALPAGWTQDQVDLFYDGGDIDEEPNDDEAELYDLIRDREDSKETEPLTMPVEEIPIEPMSPEELKKYKGKLGGDELGYSDDMKDYQAKKEEEEDEEEVEETGVSSDEYPQDRKDNTVNIPFTEAQLLQKGSESYKVLENNASIRFE